MKRCSSCAIEKELSCFRKNKSNKDGFQYQCKECHSKSCSSSFKKLPFEVKEKRKHNVKQWRERNKNKVSKYSKAYKTEKRTQLTALENKRRASKLNQTPKWLTVEQEDNIESEYRLAKFFQELSGGFVKYHVDHIVPLQGKNVRGLHVPWNLTVLKATDNCSKGNKFYG